jgi:hypothetical protein
MINLYIHGLFPWLKGELVMGEMAKKLGEVGNGRNGIGRNGNTPYTQGSFTSIIVSTQVGLARGKVSRK